MLAAITLVKFGSDDDPIAIKKGLVIGGVVASGRVPFGFDSVQQHLVDGSWRMPNVGDSLPMSGGGSAKWREVTVGKDGGFGNLPNGYFATTVSVEAEGSYLLQAAGDSLVYVNGELRAGDPYGYGYLKLPVWLHKGVNTLLFSVGRGSLNAKLLKPRSTVQIETGDSTTPDILVDGPKEIWAAVVLVNSTSTDQKVSVFTRNSAGEAPMVKATIPAMSLRKVPIKIRVPDGPLGKEQKFELECAQSKVLDSATLTLSVKRKNETHKETFFSKVDGSLQYYGVNPAQKPSKTNALVLTLHGASVEGIGQASAYGSKDWCTLVAPTNRRPYGFDWEDIGRLDALEVLNIAKKEFPHSADDVHLTGHSMGGHGTWSIGTLYPDLFASIAPSAGWISFSSYAGGYSPSHPTPVEAKFVEAASPSDTLARVKNTLEEKVYILHGDADDNVPVDEARHMKRVLTAIHADFEYHEQPGAGHWWGSPCVDWPGIFDQIKASRIPKRTHIDFTTPNPAVSARDEWVTILEQTHSMVPSHIEISDTEAKTENIQALQLDRFFPSLNLDRQSFTNLPSGSQLLQVNGVWHVDHLQEGRKSPALSGPFKNVYQNDFVFVVGTHGTPDENAWAAQKARYDAETFEYRGNGAVDIVTDSKYNPGWNRNVVLYGNADTNSAWKPLLANCPIQVGRKRLTAGGKSFERDDLAALVVYPHKARGHWVLVGALTGTGIKGLQTVSRLGVFSSGVAYPDWSILSPDVLKSGSKGVLGCGFFDNLWKLSPEDQAWNP